MKPAEIDPNSIYVAPVQKKKKTPYPVKGGLEHHHFNANQHHQD